MIGGRGVWLLLGLPLLLAAAPPNPADPSVPALRGAVDTQRQARAVARDAAQQGASAAAVQVKKLQAQLVDLGRSESDGRRTIGGARERLQQVNVQEAELKLKMGRNQESLTRLMGALQMYQRDPPPALLVDPRSARDAVRAAILIKAIAPELERRAHVFTSQSEALKGLRRQADAASGTLFQAESAVADRQARIQDLIEQKRALQVQLVADAAVANGDVQRLAARARSLGELVTTLGDHDAAGRDTDENLPPRLTQPVQGAEVYGFGAAGGDPQHAKGLTWRADANATVLSPTAAMIDYAGPLKGWGLVLILKAGDYHLVMAGLGSVVAEVGRTVAAGEPVGRMPPDGRPELYLEVRRAARPVDPSRWFAAASVNGPVR
ncbi:murein hydrolase activator EnvC [Caulobacter sp. S45]|jgi:septal ring factor EnvC (AmiA/AmiB activator)|uniref:murein hydrolase activator EnvC family protein n=1 Tax=Caulobacter sp. S45 TaxID=1641861 RepID=UPI00131E9400|nr:peptidoglycan DD-metalloendopeptidase family protein [Caulobacter sp. S45]